MTNVISFGRDDVSGRELYGLHLKNPDELSELILSSPKFVCFIAWDSSKDTGEAISRVAEILLRSGCVYLCAWGDDCERIHDIMDETCVGPNPSEGAIPVIMTTWHQDESLDEALWFFLNSAWPDDEYFDDCRAAIAITIGGGREIQDRITFALTNLREFSSNVLSREEDVT